MYSTYLETFSLTELPQDNKLPLFVDKQFPNEVFRQIRGLREELPVELVVAGHDVGVGLLLGVAQEGGGAGQTGGRS